MIRFFNVNNPSVLIFLFFYVVMLNAVQFIHPSSFTVAETTAPFSNLFFHVTGFLFGNNHYVLAFFSIVLVFVQSILINSLVNNLRLFASVTYVPAIIYALMASLFQEFLCLTPALLAATFIIFAISRAAKFYKQHRCFSETFDMGFFIGIASLFYMPVALLILLLFISLAVMRTFNWREWIIALLGFLTIYFLTGTWFFINGSLGVFIYEHFFLAPFALNRIDSGASIIIIGSITGILVIAALIIFLFNFLKSPVLSRKFLTLMGWTALLLALSCLLNHRFSLNHFVVLSVPLSVLISYLFMNIKRVRIANVMHWIWLVAVLFFQYYKTS